MGRDHSCEVCGRGGFNDPDGQCVCPRETDALDIRAEPLARRIERLEEELAFVAYALREYDIYRPPAEAQERLREIIARYQRPTK